MRIGVYGDSFADSADAVKPFTWYKLLEQMIPNSTIESFGEGGSAVYYSYNKFLETHAEFDTVIFLVTEPNRYAKKIPAISGFDRWIPSLQAIEILKSDKATTIDNHIFLNHLTGYYMVQDTDYNLTMTELMLKHVETIRKDIIYFPCFPDSLTKERRQNYHINKEHNLCNFHQAQIGLLDLKIHFGYMIEKDTISCHFTEEFSEAVATGFAKKILTNQWDWSDIYNIKKLPHEITHYYTPRKKYEQAAV